MMREYDIKVTHRHHENVGAVCLEGDYSGFDEDSAKFLCESILQLCELSGFGNSESEQIHSILKGWTEKEPHHQNDECHWAIFSESPANSDIMASNVCIDAFAKFRDEQKRDHESDQIAQLLAFKI
jgi:hypothetical protein